MFQPGETVLWDWKHKSNYGMSEFNKQAPYPLKVKYEKERQIGFSSKYYLGQTPRLDEDNLIKWGVCEESLSKLNIMKPFSMKPVTVLAKDSEEVFP